MENFVQLTRFGAPRAPWSVQRKEIVPIQPQRVWKALTVPEELCRWWSSKAEVDLRQGGCYRFAPPAVLRRSAESPERESRRQDFEIIECQEGQRLRFAWFVDGVDTEVSYEISTVMEQTELLVTQTAQERPHGLFSDSDAPNWWWVALPNLRTYLETGRPALLLDGQIVDSTALKLEVDVTTFPWVIWSKLTETDQLRRWWSDDAEADAHGGFRFGAEGARAFGPSRIVASVSESRLVHDWIWQDGGDGEVEWTLLECDDAVRVTIHDRTRLLPSVRREQRLIYWAATLLLLKQMSERGVTPKEYQEPSA